MRVLILLLSVLLTGLSGCRPAAESTASADPCSPDSPRSAAAMQQLAATPTDVQRVVDAAQAFAATLSEAQRETLVLDLTAENAARWSNLPIRFVARNGLQFGDLDEEQLAAMHDLAKTVLSADGYATFYGVVQADEYLTEQTGNKMWDADLYYVAFLGEPSAERDWILQLGGHHYGLNVGYTAGTASTTPYFLGVEPMRFTLDGETYEPMAGRETTMMAMMAGLDDGQREAARVSGSFDDVLLGPGEDFTFPKQEGLSVASLSADQQALVIAAIEAWVSSRPPDEAAILLAAYTSDAAREATTIGWSSGTDLKTEGSYIRIDGPRVWVEVVAQGGIAFRDQVHLHSIWRDKTFDYGGLFTTRTDGASC
ncbi:MAG: DUF3500 domain-containing protein [Bacteroidota bacterium]